MRSETKEGEERGKASEVDRREEKRGLKRERSRRQASCKCLLKACMDCRKGMMEDEMEDGRRKNQGPEQADH